MTLALDQTYPNPSSLFSYTCTGQMNSNLTTSQIACHTDERWRFSVKVFKQIYLKFCTNLTLSPILCSLIEYQNTRTPRVVILTFWHFDGKARDIMTSSFHLFFHLLGSRTCVAYRQWSITFD